MPVLCEKGVGGAPGGDGAAEGGEIDGGYARGSSLQGHGSFPTWYSQRTKGTVSKVENRFQVYEFF